MKDDVTKGAGDPRSFEERVVAHLDAMDARLDKVEARLAGLETRMSQMEENIDARFAVVDRRLDRLEESLNSPRRETRQIWESVQFEIWRLHATLNQYERTKQRQKKDS